MYRTVITLNVLSEEPLAEMDLADIAHECDEGSCVGEVSWGVPEKLSGKEMADALYAAGSEPAFFMLDDEGNSDFDDEGSEAACPACGKMRADALGANVFKVGSVCPYCGHVEGGSDD